MEIKANDRKVINTQPLDYLFTQGGQEWIASPSFCRCNMDRTRSVNAGLVDSTGQ